MSALFDQDTLVHKIATYGVGLALVLFCFLRFRGGEEVNPAWGWLIVAFLFYYAFVSRRIIETLIFASVIGVIFLSGRSGFIDGYVEQIYGVMSSEDYMWLILNCALFNIVCKLLSRAGSMTAIANFVKRFAKSRRSVNLITWLMQFPLFFDDFLHIIVLGKTMTPIYDEVGAPREDEGVLIQTAGEPIRVLFPMNSWTPFMVGLFLINGIAANNSEGFKAFVKTIPFNFYCWIALIGSLLFALGILPKMKGNKNPDKSLYKSMDEIDSETEETVGEAAKHGNLFDFFAPILLVIVLSYFFEWDLVPPCIIAIPVICIYYLVKGIISTKDIEDCFISGTAELTNMYILILFSYILAGTLEEMGYIDYLVTVAQGVANPKLLPVAVFLIFCFSEAAMSLNWSMLLIAFPVLLPLSLGIGANPYLVAAALISAGAFGNNFCYICDFSAMTSSFIGLPTAYHARNCMTYSLMFAGVAAVCFLAAGFIV